MSIKLPTLYNSSVGNEPSLRVLLDFYNKNPSIIMQKPMISTVLEKYERFVRLHSEIGLHLTSSYYKPNHYYLYGNMLVDIETQVTNELLQECIEITRKRYKEHGGPTNSFEAASMENTYNEFLKYIELIQMYYSHLEEESENKRIQLLQTEYESVHDEIKYMPGGYLYQKVVNLWNERNQM